MIPEQITQDQVNQAVRILGLDPDQVAQLKMTSGGVRAELWDGNPRMETTWKTWTVKL